MYKTLADKWIIVVVINYCLGDLVREISCVETYAIPSELIGH